MTFDFFSYKLNLTHKEKDVTTKIMHKKCYGFLREFQNRIYHKSFPKEIINA